MTIDVRIEALALHGCLPLDRDRVKTAFKEELERLLSAAVLPPALLVDVDVRQLDARRTPVSGEPEQQGRQIAQAVYRSLAGARGRHEDEHP